MAGDYLAHNLTIGADNQFILADEIVMQPKSLGDVMNNLAIRIIEKTKQEIDNEGLNYSSVLRQSVVMPVTFFGQIFTAELIMADYYDYQNKGVKGSAESGDLIKTGPNKGRPWIIKAPNSPYSYKDKKPPIRSLSGWANTHRMNVYALQQIIFKSGMKPRPFFDRVMEDINNGEIRRKFVLELRKTGSEVIVRGMKELLTR